MDDSRSSSRTLSSVMPLDHGCLVLLPPPHRLQDNFPCLLLEVLGLQHTLGSCNSPPPHNCHLRLPLQSGGKAPFKRRTHLLCSSLRPCATGLPSRRAVPSHPDEADTGLQEHHKFLLISRLTRFHNLTKNEQRKFHIYFLDRSYWVIVAIDLFLQILQVHYQQFFLVVVPDHFFNIFKFSSVRTLHFFDDFANVATCCS